MKLKPTDWIAMATAITVIICARLLIGNRAGRDWVAAMGAVVIVAVLIVRLVGWIRYKKDTNN